MIKEIVSVIFVLGAIDWITSSEGEYVFHSGIPRSLNLPVWILYL